MSGHSKWATIKHKKGATDAKRGKIFTRLIKEISIAAKSGGGDPDGNPRLRTAILAAKAENMPAENIKRAIQRGTGELEGLSVRGDCVRGLWAGRRGDHGAGADGQQEPGGERDPARVPEEQREPGRVGIGELFVQKKGVIAIEKSNVNEDKLTEIALDAGADDLADEGDRWEVITGPKEFDAVLEAIKAAKITPEYAEVTMVASTHQKLEGNQATAMMRLLEVLEDLDDTQNVYTNFDMDEATMAANAG